jgi:hypothetical protein
MARGEPTRTGAPLRGVFTLVRRRFATSPTRAPASATPLNGTCVNGRDARDAATRLRPHPGRREAVPHGLQRPCLADNTVAMSDRFQPGLKGLVPVRGPLPHFPR